MLLKRKRFKQTETLQDRIAQFADRMRRKADTEPEGAEKDELLKKVRNAEHAVSLERQLRASR